MNDTEGTTMETERIDQVTSIMARTGARRRALQVLTTAAAAAALVGPVNVAAARTRTVNRRTSDADLGPSGHLRTEAGQVPDR